METKNNTRAEKLKILFATHPKVDVFYLTSSNKAFFTEDDANALGQQLEDSTVTKCERDSVEATEQLEKEISEINDQGSKEVKDQVDQSSKDQYDESGDDPLVEPTDKMVKEQLADWLNEQDVDFDLKDTKPVLLAAAQDKYLELTKTTEE